MSQRLLESLARHAAERPGAVAYQTVSNRLTYGQLYERSISLAGKLREKIEPGDVVILCCRNSVEFPIAFLGVLAAGGAVFPVASDIAPPELIASAEVSRAAAVIGIKSALSTLGSRVKLAIAISELSSPPASSVPSAICPLPSSLLLHSSGTTGRPKIVRREAESIDAVCANMVEAIGFGPADRVLATAPLCHSYGVEHGLLAPIWAGSQVRLLQGFDLAAVMAELTGGATIFPGVPSMFEMMARLGGKDLRFESLAVAYSAGGALPQVVYEAMENKFALGVGQLYGATEIGSITFSDPRQEHFDPRSVGKLMTGVTARVGGAGEVSIRAPSMFSGYLGEAESVGADGFFDTGDLGRLDEFGNLTITGRIKLLIDIDGRKVNPLEVEELICRHPDVGACVVAPVQLSQTVYRLKAIVTPRVAGRAPSLEGVRAFARENLSAYKVPRVFEIRDSLPTGPTGKILRHLVQTS